ncbi:MAG: hypothetical protein IPM50_03165 [Acidobacteriota bacterium]|nr:MAG: hypothetical protein IPM50_03165 [Acidobacteriota bacterium]
MAERISIEQLRKHAPNNQMLAFMPVNTGSPMQDWCAHLSSNPLRRRELEEFSILGDVVVRIADELEPEALDRVRIMSLEYAMKVLSDETDAKEFVRCVKAIASPDAGQFEYEQIASYYYGEIRRRSVNEVLHEMGLLGMQLEAVTATTADREISFEESRMTEQKLCVADQRRVQEAAKNRSSLPPKCPNFDDEMQAVLRRVGRQKISRMMFDDFAEFYLEDGDKSIEELDRDFTTFDQLEQFDENGLIGITMSSSQRSVVVFDLDCEIDANCLPYESRELSSQLPKLFVGHSLGGNAVQEGRRMISCAGWAMPSRHPFSDREFEEWLALSLDQIYDSKVIRSVRRIYSFKQGSFEILVDQEINPDFEEMQYAASVLRLMWQRQYSDFHLRSLRHDSYQETYLAIRGTSDTADLAELKKKAYADFKEHKSLSLKEFTALNTVAKSQEVRLKNQLSIDAKRWLRKIEMATLGQLRFLKFGLYNDPAAKAFKRQEKQKLWDAVRARDAELNETVRANRTIQASLFTQPNVQRTQVKVVHAA